MVPRANPATTGTAVSTRPAPVGDPLLTPQEAQIGRLALDGLSNPEIRGRLFITSKIVQYHLTKVFTKLGISSRAELHAVLPS